MTPQGAGYSLSVATPAARHITRTEASVSAPSTDRDMRPAQLDESALEDVRALEDRLGIPVVAYEAASPYASLSAEQLEEIRRTESALGVRLLAYRP